jgi:hypothetical protein
VRAQDLVRAGMVSVTETVPSAAMVCPRAHERRAPSSTASKSEEGGVILVCAR